MKTTLYLNWILISGIILGVAACTPAATPTAAEAAAVATIPAIDYQNLTYQVEDQSVTLVNGLSEVEAAPGSASKTVTRYYGNEAYGDLNGDGKEDVAFLLTQEAGGSGTFFYVTAALNPDVGTNALFLGDRISPQSTSIEDATITVSFLDRNPEEAFTVEPTVPVTKFFRVENERLIEVSQP